MTNNRRRAAMTELGFANEAEERIVTQAIDKEKLRRLAKEEKLRELQESPSYQLISTIAKWADKYFLDAIIGFIPTIGDIISSVVGLPFIYVTLVKVKSIPLTLAVIYNYLIDILLGSIPFFIGDCIDAFHRAHLMNIKLINKYVEDDKKTVQEVNSKAFRVTILIVVLCVVIYYLIKVVTAFVEWVCTWLDTGYHWIIGLF